MNTMNHLLGGEFNSTRGWWSVNTHLNYFVFYKYLLIQNQTFYLFLQGHNRWIAEIDGVPVLTHLWGHLEFMPIDFVRVLLQLPSHFHPSLFRSEMGGVMVIFLCFVLFYNKSSILIWVALVYYFRQSPPSEVTSRDRKKK